MDQEELLNKYFSICEFNDECDHCGNAKQEQSWAMMSGCQGEVYYYVCQTCALGIATKWEVQNKEDLESHGL